MLSVQVHSHITLSQYFPMHLLQHCQSILDHYGVEMLSYSLKRACYKLHRAKLLLHSETLQAGLMHTITMSMVFATAAANFKHATACPRYR